MNKIEIIASRIRDGWLDAPLIEAKIERITSEQQDDETMSRRWFCLTSDSSLQLVVIELPQISSFEGKTVRFESPASRFWLEVEDGDTVVVTIDRSNDSAISIEEVSP